MKVEKDLGFVNEIPVYVNGKKKQPARRRDNDRRRGGRGVGKHEREFSKAGYGCRAKQNLLCCCG